MTDSIYKLQIKRIINGLSVILIVYLDINKTLITKYTMSNTR